MSHYCSSQVHLNRQWGMCSQKPLQHSHAFFFLMNLKLSHQNEAMTTQVPTSLAPLHYEHYLIIHLHRCYGSCGQSAPHRVGWCGESKGSVCIGSIESTWFDRRSPPPTWTAGQGRHVIHRTILYLSIEPDCVFINNWTSLYSINNYHFSSQQYVWSPLWLLYL